VRLPAFGPSVKWALRISAAAALFLAGSLTLIVVMAMFGPVSLSFLTTRLESAVNAELDGFQVRFRDTTLDWSDGSGRVNLTLVDATVVGSNGEVLAQAPRVSIGLSAGALLQGRAVLRWIALEKPSARLLRRADGSVQLGLVAAAATPTPLASGTPPSVEAPANSAFVDRMIDILRNPAAGGDFSRRLEAFAIRDASLQATDEITGTNWAATDADFELTRQAGGGVKAELTVAASLPGGVAWTVSAEASMPVGDAAFEVRVQTGDVTPSHIAAAPEFAALRPLQFPVRAQAHFLVGKGGLAGPVQAWLTAGAGRLVFPGWETNPGKFGGAEASMLIDVAARRGQILGLSLKGESKGEFKGAFALGQDAAGADALAIGLRGGKVRLDLPALFERALRLDSVEFAGVVGDGGVRIDKAALTLNSFKISLRGSVRDSAVSPAVQLDGGFTGLTVEELKSVWPKFAAPNARAWVTGKISKARMPTGTIKVALAADSIVDNMIPDEGLTITFPFEGMDSDYLDGLPPLTNARGVATLRGDTFEVSAEEGVIGPVKLRNGKVFIPQLHLTGTVAAISGEVSSSMSNIMTLLDAPRLGYPKRFGLKPSEVKGSADVQFTFNVPTLRDLKAEEVGIKVSGTTKGLAVALTDSIRIDDGDLTVDITGEGLVASGNSRVNSVPMRLTWSENFNPQGRPSTTIESEAVLDDAMRSRLGLDFQPYVEGPVKVNAGFSGSGANLDMATIMLDFDRARINAPELNWTAGPGNKVIATAKLSLKTKGVVIMNNLRAVGGDVSAIGRLIIGGGAIREAVFEQVRLGPLNDFAVVAKTPEIGEQLYVVTGRALDASELIAGIDSGKDIDPKTRIKRPYNISATLQQVTLRGDAFLQNVIFRNQTDGIRMKTLDVAASYPGGGTLRADLVPLSDGQRRLRVTSTDAGKLIRAMTGFRSVLGGAITLHADLPRLPRPGDLSEMAIDPPARYQGVVKVENFKVINQPFLARLFAAGSFGGLGDLLSGEGIGFTKLDGSFVGQGDVVRVVDGRASGTSVGVTFQGKFDRITTNVDFDGTLVPLYGLNSMFEDIPLVGDILTSRKGEGIIGFTYEVAGKTENLDIMVNPLSALTPGIFRRIFQAGRYPDEGRRPAPGARPGTQPAIQPPPRP
jgi:hypothetical protein